MKSRIPGAFLLLKDTAGWRRTACRGLPAILLGLLLIQQADAAREEAVLGEVVVGGRAGAPGRSFLRDTLAPVESCTVDEALRAGASNLNEAIDKRPGVAVQVECSICNARFISLNNLPGRYTTLLIDGVPLFSSVSQAYGLDSVGLRGLERIDLMRGAGAAGLAPESLAGAVNLLTRRPQKDEVLVEAAIGSHGHRRQDVQLSTVVPGGAVTANFHGNAHRSVDADHDGVSEYTGYTRRLGGLGFFVDDLGGFRLKGRVDAVDEQRNGGAQGTDYAGIKASRSGNPFDFSRGVNASPWSGGWVSPADGARVAYDAGRAGLSEIILTERYSAYLSGQRRTDLGVLDLAVGYARHDQDSFYEGNLYRARQNQGYLGGSLKSLLLGGVWTFLADWRYEDLRSRANLPDGRPADGLDNYVFRVPGLGVGTSYAFFDDRLEAGVNLRWEQHNVYGRQFATRANLLWRHDEHASSRISSGLGYRAPTSYFEQDHGILETLLIRNDTRGVEKSRNLMYSFDYQDGDWKWLANAHVTRLTNLAWLDVGETQSVLRSAAEPVTVKGGDVQLGYQLTRAMSASLGLERTHYDFPVGTLAFARPDRRAYLTFGWEHGPWDAFWRGTWTGPQNLARFYYRDQQHYAFNGAAKPDKSPAFWTVDARVQYAFDKRWAAFVGAENLFDYKQVDRDAYLWVGRDNRLDVTHIWGPNRGRFVYFGLRFEG